MAAPALSFPLVALDTNFLLDLAAGNAVCLDCLAVLSELKRAPELVATATVLQELAHLYAAGDSKKKRDLAETALKSLIGWGVNPLQFIPVGHGIIERIGDEIRSKGLLPQAERNDSYVIAEAALANCSLLISSDIQVTGVNQDDLRHLLASFDVEPLAILWPAAVMKRFGKK